MRIPWRAREYERTCDNCGYAWRAPRWAVHPPMQGLPFAGLGSGMGRGTGGGRSALRYEVNSVVESNAELAEEAAAFRVCAKCGSVRYKQRRI
jgi:hypothetical protein